MSKPVKNMVIEELASSFQGVDSACVVDLTGTDAIATHKLRGVLHQKGIRLQIVKNRLARKAFADGPLEPLSKAMAGPCALVTGGASIVDVAKELMRLTKDVPTLKLKQAIVEGDASLLDVEQLSTWKSRNETIGEVAMLIASPGRRVAGCVRGPGGRLAGCVKAVVEKQEETPAAA